MNQYRGLDVSSSSNRCGSRRCCCWVLLILILFVSGSRQFILRYKPSSIKRRNDGILTNLTHLGLDWMDETDRGKNLVFVIGNGRTGTNWLGDILLSHHEIIGKNERQPEFGMVTDLAVRLPLTNKTEQAQKLLSIAKQYRKRSIEAKRYNKTYHSDKSHPALFFAPELQSIFPDARFVGVNRCVYPTVASCVKHRGVSGWFKQEALLKSPNKFLGITQENLNSFSDFPAHVQCALRWASHQLEYKRVYPMLNQDASTFLLLDYRMMHLEPKESLAKLQHFLGLQTQFNEAPSGHEFDPIKWKKSISGQQRREIDLELRKMGYYHLVLSYCHETERS